MKKIVFSLLLVLFSVGAWADNQKEMPSDYIAPGDFYWTRTFWKRTVDTVLYGETRFADETGYVYKIRNPYVLGLELTGWTAAELHKEAMNLLKRYDSSHEKNAFKDYPDKVGRSIKHFFTKTWTHLTHKAEKIGEIAVRNHDSAVDLEKKSTVLSLLSYPLYTAKTVVHSAVVIGFELPVEFTGRTFYRTGEISYHAFSPLGPAAGMAVIYLGVEPCVISMGVSTAVVAGITGITLTGLVATVEGTIEGGKWIVGNRAETSDSRQTSASSEKAMLYVKLPSRSEIEKMADHIFTNSRSKAELFDGFEQLIASVPAEEKWVALSNIVGRLERTIQDLEESLDGKSTEQQTEIIKERDELSTLKTVYALDLEKNIPRDLEALAYTQ
ncbi:MAG: hypothetical protein HYY61_00075 [Deltaproteobacteria bacterium]|nr:hypothetical protein [Deltaproteobacteria bacterium]